LVILILPQWYSEFKAAFCSGYAADGDILQLPSGKEWPKINIRTKTDVRNTPTSIQTFIIMRVVVFGASGVQGAAQVAALTNAGHDAVAISRNPKPLEINGKKVETVALDFDNEKGVAEVLKGADVIFVNLPSTFVIHCVIVLLSYTHNLQGISTITTYYRSWQGDRRSCQSQRCGSDSLQHQHASTERASRNDCDRGST
jgi:hypothetical protein